MPASLRRARLLLVVLISMAALGLQMTTSAPAARSATVPGLNGRIVFQRYDGSIMHILTTNPDGSNEKELSTSDNMAQPTFSPAGTQIAYYDRDRGLAVMNADGTNQHLVIANFNGMGLEWSPDGSRLLTGGRGPDGVHVIVVVGADGSDFHRLNLPGESPLWPAWSPDGTQIVYSCQFDISPSDTGIWIGDVDGSGARMLAGGYRYEHPKFSPDGQHIVFSATYDTQPQTFQILTMGADGSNLHAIGPVGGILPVFSPDGTEIAFSGGDIEGLFVMEADGSNVRQISHGSDWFASWQSLPAPPPPNQPPVAIGRGGKPTPRHLWVDGSLSTDADGTIVSYLWRWGDYTPPTAKSKTSHDYAKPGTYLVRLTVTDNQGASSTVSGWIKVT